MMQRCSQAFKICCDWMRKTTMACSTAHARPVCLSSRPRGVDRAEIFVALTPAAAPAPSDMHAYRYVQSVSDVSTVLTIESPQGGMQAHYLARCVTRRGAMGPWSDTSSATVAA
jgi:hypothetical protein